MARRRKEDHSERRTAFVGVHLTPTAHAEVTRRAALYGLPVSDFAGKVLLSDLKAPPPPPREARAIRALAFQLTALGNNQNQMTKLAHQLHALPQQAEYRRLAEQIVAALEKVLAL